MLSKKALSASVETPSVVWDVSGASYTGTSYDTIGSGSPRGFRWNPNGTTYYISNGTSVWEFDVSTPFVVIYTGSSFRRILPETIWSISFSPDGINMYLAGLNNIYQYQLDRPWGQLSRSTYIGVSPTATPVLCNQMLGITGDGTRLVYMQGGNFRELNLSTPFDITTASNGSTYAQPSGTGTAAGAGLFSSDGTQAAFTDQTTDTVYVVDLSTAYDVSTATLNSSYYFGATQSVGNNVEIVDGSTEFWILRTGSDFVYKYTM